MSRRSDEWDTEIHIVAFAARPYDSGWEDLCYDVIRGLVIPFYKGIRRQLLENLGDVDHRAFELGECIEQGPCRPDIYRHLHNAGSLFILLSEALPMGEPEEEDAEEGVSGDQNGVSESYDAHPQEVIADQSWSPGELQPNETWFDELPIAWTRAGLGTTELPEFTELGRKIRRHKSVLQDEVDATIRNLHTTACQNLTILFPDTQPFEMTYQEQVEPQAATVGTSQSDSPAAKLTDLHITAMKGAVRCVAQQIGSPLSSSQPAANRISDTQDNHRATLSFVDGKPVVRFVAKNCDIPRGKSACLLNLLYHSQANDHQPTYKKLFEAVYPKDCYNPDSAGGAPEKLRQLAKRLNNTLKKKLDLPPNGKPWIRTTSGYGYYLTDAVTWQAKADWREHDFDGPSGFIVGRDRGRHSQRASPGLPGFRANSLESPERPAPSRILQVGTAQPWTSSSSTSSVKAMGEPGARIGVPDS